jgi:hypothetical protein
MIRNPFDPSRLTLALLLAPIAILAPAPTLHAEAPEEDTYLGESPERYAQVKVVEGDVRIHKGEGEEPLSRGIPIAEGDVVESRGRGVLQLGDGSRIGFGSGTRFQVAALFTDKKGDRQVLLRLDYGRIRVALGAQSDARIRVDTPSGMATLVGDKGSATCEVDHDRTVRLRVHSGRVSFANDADRTTISAGERITIYGSQDRLDRIRSFNTYDADSFDEWCDDHFTIRRRASWDKVPQEIRYYADDLDEHGEWIYVDETSSWCWRPIGVSVEWRPYWRGRWGAYAGGMTWISDEPWGYVTYHHGRWGWGAGLGWYWIPGVYYSPAWVAWNTCDTYFGWAPLGYWNAPCHWGYGAWGGGYCWNVVNVTHINAVDLHARIYSDRGVIGTFNRGTGGGTWTGTGNPGRPVIAGYQRGPLLVTRAEFANPAQFQRTVSQRPVLQERVQVYERQAQAATGRAILRRDTPMPGPTDRGTPTLPGRETRSTPFEDRSRPVPGRPVIRDSRPAIIAEPSSRASRPAETGRIPQETPRARTEDRPRETDRPASRGADRPAAREIPRETPRETPRERDYRPREADRTAPREVPRERPRDSFREEGPRERPAPIPREAPRSEPARPSAPAPSPAPAPRASAPERPAERPKSR